MLSSFSFSIRSYTYFRPATLFVDHGAKFSEEWRNWSYAEWACHICGEDNKDEEARHKHYKRYRESSSLVQALASLACSFSPVLPCSSPALSSSVPCFSLDRRAQTDISHSRTADPDDTIKWPRGQPADAHHVRCHHRTDERRVFRNAVHDLGQQGCSEIIDARGLDDDDEEENAVEERLPDPTTANGALKTVSQKPTAGTTAAATAVVEIDELDSALSVEVKPAVAPSMPAKPAAWLLEQLKAFQDKRLDPSTQNGRLGSSPMARPTVQTVQTQAPKAAFAFASKSQTGPLEPSLLPGSPTKKLSAASMPSSPAADWAAKVRKYNFPVSPPTSDTVPEGEEKGKPGMDEQDCMAPSSPTKSKGETICLVSPSPVDKNFPVARSALPSPSLQGFIALPNSPNPVTLPHSPSAVAVALPASPTKRARVNPENDDHIGSDAKRRRVDVVASPLSGSRNHQAYNRLQRLLTTAGKSLVSLGESLHLEGESNPSQDSARLKCKDLSVYSR